MLPVCYHSLDYKVNLLHHIWIDGSSKTVFLRRTEGSLPKALFILGICVSIALTSAVYLHKGSFLLKASFSTLHILWLSFLHTITQQPFGCSLTLLKKSSGITSILSVTCVPGRKIMVCMAFTITLQRSSIRRWQHPYQKLRVLTYLHPPIFVILFTMSYVFLMNIQACVGKITMEYALISAVTNCPCLRYVVIAALHVLLASLTNHILHFNLMNCFSLKILLYMLMAPVTQITAVLQIVRPPRKYSVIIKMI